MNKYKFKPGALTTLVCFICISACSTSRYEWRLNGRDGPGYIFERDSKECRNSVERSFPSAQIYVTERTDSKYNPVITTRLVDGPSYREQKWNECMAGNGWQQTLVKQVAKRAWCADIDNFCDSVIAPLGNQRSKAEPENMAKRWCPDIDAFCENSISSKAKE